MQIHAQCARPWARDEDINEFDHGTDHTSLRSIMQPTRVRGDAAQELRDDELLRRPVPRGRRGVVVDADHPRRVPRRAPLRRLPVTPGYLPQHPQRAPHQPGRRRCPRAGALPGAPPRHEYRLTVKGRDLWPVLTTMREWGDKWAAPTGPPLEVVHDACGEVMHLQHTCSACGETADQRSVRARPGPGATPSDFDRTALLAPT